MEKQTLIPTDIQEDADRKFTHDGIFSSGSDYESADEIVAHKKSYIRGRMEEHTKGNYTSQDIEDYGHYCIELVSGGYSFPSLEKFKNNR